MEKFENQSNKSFAKGKRVVIRYFGISILTGSLLSGFALMKENLINVPKKDNHSKIERMNEKKNTYSAPVGYTVTGDENGQLVGQRSMVTKEEKIYSVPVGYTLTRDENGQLVGQRSMVTKEEKIYSVPVGYTLTGDENGQLVSQRSMVTKEENIYSVPVGYTLTRDENGQLVGQRNLMSDQREYSMTSSTEYVLEHEVEVEYVKSLKLRK